MEHQFIESHELYDISLIHTNINVISANGINPSDTSLNGISLNDINPSGIGPTNILLMTLAIVTSMSLT
jgi:hypothetical protein